MSEIILNERARAEYAINNNELGNKPVETLGRVARYFYEQGYNKRDIPGMLEDFLLKCDSSANIVKWQSIIDKQAANADKYPLINIDGVPITQQELDKISKIGKKLPEKLMFTMLCLAKYGNAVNAKNNNWVNKADKEIFSLANIALTIKRQSLMINDLWKMDYIGYSRVVDNININVKIVDNDNPAVMFITDFRNLGIQYLRYKGERCIECQCCGKVVKENNHKQKLCKECAVEIDRRRAVERYYRRISSKSSEQF